MLSSKLLQITIVASLAGVTVMCVPDRSSAPTYSDGPPLTAAQAAAVNARARLPHGRAELHWVPELHTRAMQEWLSSRRQLASLSKQDACARLVQLVRSFLPDVKRATRGPGDQVEAAYEQAIALARIQVGCEGQAAPLAIWSATPAHLAAAQEADTVVTGAYEEFVPLIESAITSAESPDQAVAAVDGVLSQAVSLPAPDFEVLAAMASLAASSAWYWYEVEVSVNGGGEAMSIFAPSAGRFSWRLFGAADLAGGVAVVRGMRFLGAVHPYLLIAGFFGGAAVGSAIYAYDNQE